MRKLIVNTYFFLNLFGSILGILLAIASYVSGYQLSINPILLGLGFIEFIFLIPSFWMLGSSQIIPRRTFLPVFLAYAIPLIQTEEAGTLPHVFGTVVVAVISLYCFYSRRRLTGNAFGIILAEMLSTETRSIKRFLPILGAASLTSILSLGAFVYHLVDETVLKEAQGIIAIRWDGLYTKSVIFEKGEKKAIVLSMLHYADRDFYEDMFERIPNEGSLVFLEGILDKKGLYGRFTPHSESRYGLTSQFGTFNKWVANERVSIDSDIDVSELDEDVRKYAVSEFRSGSIAEKATASAEDKALVKSLEDRKMAFRNHRMTENFDRHESEANTLVFTWGAVHTPYIVKILEERGYKKNSSFEQRAIAFW